MTAQAEILQPHTHTHTVQLIAVESFDTHATQGVSSKICDLTARTSSDEENKKKQSHNSMTSVYVGLLCL